MTLKGLAEIRQNYLIKNWNYERCYYTDFNYEILKNAIDHKSKKKDGKTYNDITIMADTETSKHDDYYQISYMPEYNDILDMVRSCKFIWSKRYIEVASKSALKIAGIKFNGNRSIDSLYEELSQLYPWIFKEVAYSDTQALEYIYDYIISYDPPAECKDNHVVVWTVSIRLFDLNIVTLWGRKPSELCDCFDKIHSVMEGEKTFIYFHNLSYDYIFIRKFLNRKFGRPVFELNVKPYYPISLEYENGLVIKDSLILAQRSLNQWCIDMSVEHKKAKGDWDYSIIRHQDTDLTDEELHYAEYDTLGGVECLDALKNQLGKNMGTMPLTATGITREKIQKRGRSNKARRWFLNVCADYTQYKKQTKLYHGGYTHGNRHYLDVLIDDTWEGAKILPDGTVVKGKDFASSYPYSLFHKYPASKFVEIDNKSIDFILENSDEYAFMFKLCAVDIEIKDDAIQMPFLQYSKCEYLINDLTDNGRIIAADYAEIYLNEIDLEIINEQYKIGKSICVEVEAATKDYLPRWFTDIIYEFFVEKTKLKDVGRDVEYNVAKIILNSCYGLCCQRADKCEIIETDDGEYLELDPDKLTDEQLKKYKDKIKSHEQLYNEYIGKRSTILPYFIGCWCTSIASKNLFKLGSMCETWLYSDTDSCYGINWDEKAVEEYNQSCIDFMKSRGYEGVEHNGKIYYLGVAEDDKKSNYKSFIYTGAKRYAGICTYDNKLHITVAGVPKSKGAKCLRTNISKNDLIPIYNKRICKKFANRRVKASKQQLKYENINLFTKGFIFEGETTGKLTHSHIYVDDIYINEFGDEVGDSIDLSPCNYELDSVTKYSLFDFIRGAEEVEIQIAEDVDDLDLIV